jgi:hypothetical protein
LTARSTSPRSLADELRDDRDRLREEVERLRKALAERHDDE